MPAQEIYSEWAKALAEQLVASGGAPPSGLSDDERLALAWALKEAAVASWNSEPTVSAVSHGVLILLRDANHIHSGYSATQEIDALAHWIIGLAYITDGRLTDALIALDHAAETFLGLGHNLFAAQTQPAKIVVLSVLGRTQDAVACGLKAQQELDELGDAQAASKIRLNLGQLYRERNDFANARHYLEQALEQFTRVGDHQHAAMTSMGIAQTCEAVGDFVTAQAMYNDLLVYTKRNQLPVLEAYVYESVCLLNLAKGRFREALGELERNRHRYDQLKLPQRSASTDKYLADAYLTLNLLPEALALFSRALSRFRDLEMPVDAAWTLIQKSRTLARMGCSQQDIDPLLTEASQLFSLEEMTTGTATVLLAKAEIAVSKQEGAIAAKFAAQASELFAKAEMLADQAQADIALAHARMLGEDLEGAEKLFIAIQERAITMQMITVQATCHVGLGQVAIVRGDPSKAETEFSAAVNMFEEQRQALPADDLRYAFLATNLRPYIELLRLALHDNLAHQSPDSSTIILIRLEKFRARVLDERLGIAGTDNTDKRRDQTTSDLRAQLNWMHRRAQQLIDDGGNALSITNETRRIELELLEHTRRRSFLESPDAINWNSSEFDATSLRLSLHGREAIVEYGVLDDELFACVVTRNGIALKRHLAKWADVVRANRNVRFQIETLRSGTSELNEHLQLLTRRSLATLQRLHDLIWVQLSDLLIDCNRVLVVPHEQLGAVPFAALHDGERFLSRRYEIAVAPSARVALRGLSLHPSLPRQAVVLGESSRLLHAAEEAQFVASLFEEATVLTGQDANGDALRAASAQADVLHLACHGQFRSDNPMFSALHLVDGPFTVQDAEALRLPQGIVVLSACESGVATASKGDEVIGLVRAFLIAGAARVVASLWPVDDAVTTEFMAVFYSSLRAGASPAAALRSAQLEVMKTHPHPFHWAAFTVYGGW